MRRIGALAKRLDVKKLLRGKDDASIRSRHFLLGLVVLSVTVFVLLQVFFDVVHQSSDHYKGKRNVSNNLNLLFEIYY